MPSFALRGVGIVVAAQLIALTALAGTGSIATNCICTPVDAWTEDTSTNLR
jgi:hypothetical protein